MPYLLRSNSIDRHVHQRLSILLLIALTFGALFSEAHADRFTINRASTTLNNKVYTFNAHINYQLSKGVLEALNNGIPLFFTMEIDVFKERWWRNKNIANLKQTYMLLHHALTEKYVLNNLNSGNQKNFSSLQSALDALGEVENLPLIDQKLLDNNSSHIVKLRTYLDLESLPGPIRPLAYLSTEWRLESEWYIWSLTP